MRRLWGFLAAVIGTYTLAVAAASQYVANRLVEMNVEVSLIQRLEWWLHDLLGMGKSLLPLVAVGLLIGIAVADWLAKKWPRGRTGLLVLAGFVALITIHIALKLSLGLHPVPSTRFIAGLLIQGLAGAFGGWLYWRLNP